MTVTGATSAAVAPAGAYTPPFKYVTSYPPAVQVTGTITSAIPNNPTGSPGQSDGDYAWAYLQTHMMSSPSYRYAYLLWMILFLIALLYTAGHHLRLNRGSPGAAVAKVSMRRIVLGSKKPGARNRALASNGVLFVLAILGVVTAAVCIVGADYITPSSSVLDFSTSFRKRASNSSPNYTIGKLFWTSGSRFGFIAFALMPLVVLFALKAPPIALFSLRPFTHLYADKLQTFHRATAWLVWALTTVHVALWTVQLFEDRYNGRSTWFALWTNYRFIFGCVAYGAFCGVMVLSLRPVRKHRYEFFYIAHVVLVFATIACAAIHHPVLWYWMAAAMALWLGERAYRFFRFAKINGLFGRSNRNGSSGIVAGRAYQDLTAKTEYELKDAHYTDKTLPRPPEFGAETPVEYSRVETPRDEFGRTTSGYYDEGSLQPLGAYDSRQGGSTSTFVPRSASGYLSVDGDDHPRPLHQRNKESIATSVPPTFTPPPIPIGYAHAQLLPSRTVRLTIRVARPFKWAPGQSALLYLPDLSWIQSHPFTIINNGESEIVLLVKARKGLTRKLFDHVRARSLAAVGLDPHKDKRMSLKSMQGGEGGLNIPPVFVKARVDGPMGSAGRTRWCDYATVLIICGGSGVSFGAAICDWVCQRMQAGRAGRTQRVHFCWVAREYAEIAWVAGQLRRCQQIVSASQLEISIFVTNVARVVSSGLDDGGMNRDEFAPPQPGFARGGGGLGSHQRRDSSDSLSSELSVASPTDTVEDSTYSHDSSSYADVIDLTNYEDEEDVNDLAEQELSGKLQHQGKVRRAKSRKAAKVRQKGIVKSPSGLNPYQSSYPPQRTQSGYADDAVEDAYAAAASGHRAYDPTHRPMSDAYPPGRPYSERLSPESQHLPLPNALSADSRRQSFRSLADSTYAQYDPFTGGGSGGGMRGPSPSPSMFFDDGQSIAGESVRDLLSRASRTQSMVLLADNGADPTGDAALWIDEADYAAMSVMSEMARPGKPKLAKVLDDEVERAAGSIIVATCGPVTLNTVVRNLVSRHISPARIRHGDKRGNIAIYSEDYES